MKDVKLVINGMEIIFGSKNNDSSCAKCLLAPKQDSFIKPRKLRIGGIDVPEPMRSAPEAGSCYFFLALTGSGMVVESEWGGNWVDELSLSRGICHTTKEAAIAHAKALILVSGGKV